MCMLRSSSSSSSSSLSSVYDAWGEGEHGHGVSGHLHGSHGLSASRALRLVVLAYYSPACLDYWSLISHTNLNTKSGILSVNLPPRNKFICNMPAIYWVAWPKQCNWWKQLHTKWINLQFNWPTCILVRSTRILWYNHSLNLKALWIWLQLPEN